MCKIALIGYGRMGREVEKVARQRNHEILLKIDIENVSDAKNLSNVDVAIDFSTPLCAPDNIYKCFNVNVPIVVGTTGWSGRLEEIKKICADKDQALFYSSNFSIGVNIFFEINRKLARLMNEHDHYDVFIEETHHKQKLDSPSGTAITMANDIIEAVDRKRGWINIESGSDTIPATSISQEGGDQDQNFISATGIEITSIRKNNVTGTHIAKYISDIDSIEIKHCANNRKGFAVGAVLAAEWIIGKKGVFTMGNMLKF
ncbi:MAG: 4-hydroxy-tetrahydrodipicolinate reductase [Bacteroidota bacterium]